MLGATATLGRKAWPAEAMWGLGWPGRQRCACGAWGAGPLARRRQPVACLPPGGALQGVDGGDVDLPTVLESSWIAGFFSKLFFTFIYLAIYAVRPLIVRPKAISEHWPPRWPIPVPCCCNDSLRGHSVCQPRTWVVGDPCFCGWQAGAYVRHTW